MSHAPPNPDRPPTPAELSAWADGELLGPAARRVEAWLAAHPENTEVERTRRLTRLYRDHGPDAPSPGAWDRTLDRIEDGLARPSATPSRRARWAWPARLVLGLVSAAAALGTVVLARDLWPAADRRPGDELAEHRPAPAPIEAPETTDEPFPVASASEVDIISIDARDVDRVALGVPLLGTFDVAAPRDIEVIDREPDPEDGLMPRLHGGPDAKVPLVVLAQNEDDEP